MNLLYLFLFAGLGVTSGDIYLGYWAKGGNLLHLFIGLVFNIIGIVFYANTLRYESIGIATAIFLSINIVAVVIFGIVFFREKLFLLQFLGIIMIIVAIMLIEI